MRKITQLMLLVVAFTFSAATFAQSTVTGTVIDADLNAPLPGANVIEEGTNNGTTTDFDGEFSLRTQSSSGEVTISFVGYASITVAFNGDTDLGDITLTPDNTLEEIIVTSIVDFARDRETPVAVSTVRASEIEARIGNQELPEILNYTPSVYATKSGGGFGDSRINIRGFDQRNTAVLINGVPVNDMENGWVYWSNWAGLSDVTTGMQVQRGLGSSKLAISSVGGTINVLTKTTDRKEGGKLSFTVGNDDYHKMTASYSTGKMDSGFATSILLSRTAGSGYVDGTAFEGYSYFLGFGYDKGDHNLQFTFTGAPQVHNQRTTSFFNMATISDYLKYGRKYNYNHGIMTNTNYRDALGRNGEFNWRKNFYHKPIASINWDWQISDNSSLASVFYASFGRGGGTGDIGRFRNYGSTFASSSNLRDPNTGHVLWDDIIRYNQGQTVIFSDGRPYTRPDDGGVNDSYGNGLTRRASMNSHNWFGTVINFNTRLSDVLTLDLGVDMRSYKGIHYRRVDNLLGANAYIDFDNDNEPAGNFITASDINNSDLSGLWNVFKDTDDDEKIDYYNDGKVRWFGAFTQLEYKTDVVSAFVQGAYSSQGYKRVEYFGEAPGNQETDWENIDGGNIKGGLNINLDEKNNIYFNTGYYARQPLFDAIWLNFRNDLNENYKNEKVFGLELGYGLRTEKFNANVNLYRTSWKDRFSRFSTEFEVNGEEIDASADLFGIEQVHMGAELEFNFYPSEKVSFRGMLSVGNWEYGSDVTARYFNETTSDPIVIDGEVQTETLYLDGVKVGDAAQLTYLLGTTIKPFENASLDLNWRTADNLFADISAEDFDDEDHQGSLQLPKYDLVDLGFTYRLFVGSEKDNNVSLRLNVNNLFDRVYLAESATNYHAASGTRTYRGIDTRNKAFFGFGRTWNMSIRYSF
jgi:outer membrane cobalamin receptor